MKIIEYSIKNRVVIVFATLVLTIAGIFSYFELGKLEDPEFKVKEAIVVTLYPGASPESVEQEVTDKIEIALRKIPNADVDSVSKAGYSEVHIKIDESIKINEDLLVNYYLFKKAKKSIFYDKCFYNYTLRKGSAATSKVNINKIIDPINVRKEILEDLEKNSDLYDIAYEKYIMSLVGICRNVQIRKNKEYKTYIDDAKKSLKYEINNIIKNKAVSKKTKLMVIGNLYFSRIFYIIDDIHAARTGNRTKYEVK